MPTLLPPQETLASKLVKQAAINLSSMTASKKKELQYSETEVLYSKKLYKQQCTLAEKKRAKGTL